MLNTKQQDFTSTQCLLTIKQVAEQLNISQSTVRRLIQSGKLKTVSLLDNVIRIKKSDFANFVNNLGED